MVGEVGDDEVGEEVGEEEGGKSEKRASMKTIGVAIPSPRPRPRAGRHQANQKPHCHRDYQDRTRARLG